LHVINASSHLLLFLCTEILFELKRCHAHFACVPHTFIWPRAITSHVGNATAREINSDVIL